MHVATYQARCSRVTLLRFAAALTCSEALAAAKDPAFGDCILVLQILVLQQTDIINAGLEVSNLLAVA